MSFEQYYSTPFSGYLLNALLWVGIMTVISVITVLSIMRWSREFERSVLVIGIIAGIFLGIGGGAMFTSFGDFERNASILQSNIEKKYDVQAVTFNFSTTKAGGYNWTPTQSEPQQVIVKVNGISRIATLTQNLQTAEPTLVDVDTKKELVLHKDASR
jgi:hypothetical protein